MTENEFFTRFDKFEPRCEEYLGSLYVKLFHHIPECYYIYYNKEKNDKLINQLNLKGLNIHRDIGSKINDYYFLKKALDKAKQDSNLKVFAYSNNEWFIINLDDNNNFLIECTISDEIVGDWFIRVFTNNIKETFKYIKPWCSKYEEQPNIEFGITAVNINNTLYTSYYDYEYKEIDIDLNYNDDLPYEKITKLLEEKQTSELLLFYGEPGTGKSSFIKHLIGKYPDKDFIFIDGSLLASVPQQNLMSYFLDNNDTIFILEDCEKVLMARDNGYNPVMPILLNMTDGIIGDVLGIKLICTFNTALSNIDKALLRKGRLSLKYEFKALNKEKVRKILNDNSINKDMILADIYNIDEENDYSKKQTSKIGF
jgi:energy-coupling factor transporter ATP-binding protein EcfA2